MRKALLWAVRNVPLGPLAPWVLGLALGRKPHKTDSTADSPDVKMLCIALADMADATWRLWNKFHKETSCGKDGLHWSECERVAGYLGEDPDEAYKYWRGYWNKPDRE